ncbi:type IV toxin-antitoxin system AbiEi family antitoxin domain-containing protein [Corynebacterium antarcticum]|uniref:type IV toxin-antitoxin system AbiEi family antitoxin domain-containing protein n=1 Tax=Corynebacterium antarcticum TaxID=2800405 RepID=UPI0020065F7F|nr:type IV toxin-antitoxin system AbiEi family antitoxin domain-containing protein [Corynebacterium antarcticum]MCK7661652.1 type IV toxin-antitoxin system AbiEi family antitoxin domain-containing protein [Corynebacterium antarcticum]
MRFSEVQPILAAYSYLQHGLVTSAQAAKEGIDTTTLTRLAQRDFLRRIRRGVYILSSVAEDPLTEIRAAWLSTRPAVLADERVNEGNPIVVSHASAVSMLELGDITPASHTFTSSKRKQSSAADITHRTADLTDTDWIVLAGIPVTTVARTIHDMAKDHLDGDQLYQIIADAIHDHRLNPSTLARVLEPYALHYGCDSGEALVSESLRRFPEHESVTESMEYTLKSVNFQLGDNSAIAAALASLAQQAGGLRLEAAKAPGPVSPQFQDPLARIGDLKSIFDSTVLAQQMATIVDLGERYRRASTMKYANPQMGCLERIRDTGDSPGKATSGLNRGSIEPCDDAADSDNDPRHVRDEDRK